MAKKENKLTLVKADNSGAVATRLFQTVTGNALPKGMKKVNRAPLLKPDQIPIGQMVSGLILGHALSRSEKAKNAVSLTIRHESGTEFLLPATGTIKTALCDACESKEEDFLTVVLPMVKGKQIMVVRQQDGETSKYCKKGEAPRKMFMFDVYLEEK